MERGLSAPDISLLPVIARHFGLTMDELFGYSLSAVSYRERFIRFLADNGALRFGQFRLRCGRFSPLYIDAARLSAAGQLRRLGGFYAECMRDNGVAAVKPQMAFFEVFGPEGLRAHQQIVQNAHRKGLLVVDDSKRCDIGNTARAYAFAHLAEDGPINADMLTVTPYLGRDSMQPFLDRAKKEGKGLFVLVRTSNPGTGEIMEAVNATGERVCDWLADHVREAGRDCVGRHGCAPIGAVVGATWPEEAARRT